MAKAVPKNNKAQDEQIKEERARGLYRYESVHHTGFIQLPFPVTENHFKKWWETAIEPIKMMTPLDYQRVNHEWVGARYLLLNYGKWGFDKVTVGEVQDGNCPLELVSFVVESVSDYLYPKLPARYRARVMGL